jgi:hypothetical protein
MHGLVSFLCLGLEVKGGFEGEDIAIRMDCAGVRFLNAFEFAFNQEVINDVIT